MSQSGQGTRDAGQTILVYNIMVDPWKKHPICVSLRAYPTVLPLPLGVLSLLLAAFSCPARVPPLPSPQVLFGGVSLPRTSAAPFLFLVGVALPVISQAQPALWIWAVGPSLPSSLPGPSSTLSIPGWTSLSYCPFPGKGYLAGQGVGDRSQEESQCRKPPSPPGAHGSLQGSGPNTSVIFRNLDF